MAVPVKFRRAGYAAVMVRRHALALAVSLALIGAPAASAQGDPTLSSAGIFGIKLGSTVADIQTAHPDFPTTAATTVTWRDCDFTFTDGKLVTISPRDGGHTAEGIRPGSPMTKAVALYGDPLAWTPDPDGTTAVVFDAGPGGEGAYRMNVDGFDPSGATPTGTIKTIVLCPCKQR